MLSAFLAAIFVIGSMLGLMAFFLEVANYMFYVVFPNDWALAFLGSFFFGLFCPLIVIFNLPGSKPPRRRR